MAQLMMRIESLIQQDVVNRWYKIGESYSSSLVYNIIKYVERRHNLKIKTVLDPFAGTGTTLVTASLLGLSNYNIEINPFYHLVSSAKSLVWRRDVRELISIFSSLLKEVLELNNEFNHIFKKDDSKNFIQKYCDKQYVSKVYPLVYKWIDKEIFNYLVAIKNFLEEKIQDFDIRRIAYVAMAPILHEKSKVILKPGRFGTFKKGIRSTIDTTDIIILLAKRLKLILNDLQLIKNIILGKSFPSIKVINADSRYYKIDEPIDLAVTSPPYPNDIEYIHQSRLELAFFGLVSSKKDFTELKKRMVSSSVKYSFYKERTNKRYVADVDEVESIASKIEEKLRGRNWGWDPANMVREYFGDMYLNLLKVWESLRDEGVYAIVVGDSAYQNVKIPTAHILGKIAVKKVGFSRYEVKMLRTRRNTRHNVALEENILFLIK